jgi:hypothetical protein
MLNDPIVPAHDEKSAVIDLPALESVALKRLIAEVWQGGEGPFDTTLYNRTYHRHNR